MMHNMTYLKLLFVTPIILLNFSCASPALPSASSREENRTNSDGDLTIEELSQIHCYLQKYAISEHIYVQYAGALGRKMKHKSLIVDPKEFKCDWNIIRSKAGDSSDEIIVRFTISRLATKHSVVSFSLNDIKYNVNIVDDEDILNKKPFENIVFDEKYKRTTVKEFIQIISK